MRLEPILVFPVVYVLRLEDDCYYVGITLNLNQRLAQHWTGCGAKWTRLHKPVEVMRVVYQGHEQDVTNEMIATYGREKVRGGSHTRCE
jgi:predicted GIY-YIG superfamily endonuclease